jgi:catechol 2,3-dioxygenase-like lactoylglutathione lyase family enzyme
MISGAQIILYVEDMERSRRFYEEIIGLALTSTPSPYWITFDCGGTSLALHPQDSLDEFRNTSAIALFTLDLEESRTIFNDRGANFGEIVEPHPGVKFCSTQDPDGTMIYLKPSL